MLIAALKIQVDSVQTDRSGHNRTQTVEQTNWQTDRLTERVAGRQTGSRFGLYDLLLWDTHKDIHKHTGTSWNIQTCH